MCSLLAIATAASCSGGGQFQSGPSGSGGSDGNGGSSASGGSRASGGSSGSSGAPATGGSSGTGAAPNTGGNAGDASVPDGGDGGSLPPPQCTQDEECAPFTCNGAPHCVGGTCAEGDPCDPPEAGNCAAECVRTAKSATCVVVGKDGDGDGFRDALCTENPGDDCDDSNRDVHPGAKEACDGVDNDCDGKKDAFDGFALNGTDPMLVKATATASAQLAIVPTDGGYALLSVQKSDFDAFGNPTQTAFLSFTGELTSNSDFSLSINTFEPVISYAKDKVLIVGRNLTTPSNGADVLTLNGVGQFGGVDAYAPVLADGTGTSTARAAAAETPRSDTSLIVWTETPSKLTGPAGGLMGLLLTDGNGDTAMRLATSAANTVHSGRPNIAASADGYAIAWVEDVANGPSERTVTGKLTIVDKRLAALGSATLDTTTTKLANYFAPERMRPQVVASGSEYYVGSLRPGGSLRVVGVSSTGSTVCGPTLLPGVSSWGAASSLVNTPLGVLAVVTDSNGDAVMYRISKGTGAAPKCEFERIGALNQVRTRVARGTRTENGDVVLSLGDPVVTKSTKNGVAVSWVERDETGAEAGDAGVGPERDHRIVLRVFDPNLCPIVQ